MTDGQEEAGWGRKGLAGVPLPLQLGKQAAPAHFLHSKTDIGLGGMVLLLRTYQILLHLQTLEQPLGTPELPGGADHDNGE